MIYHIETPCHVSQQSLATIMIFVIVSEFRERIELVLTCAIRTPWSSKHHET